MTKQELFKQADYTFQRGNRGLAKKYLTEYLSAHPDDEAAWMLMARIVEDKQGRIKCYERTLKINPGNNEARIGISRVRSTNPTLPRSGNGNSNTDLWQPKPNPYKKALRAALSVLVVAILFGTTTLVVARNNPESKMAQILAISTPDLYSDSAFAGDVAPQTRAQVGMNYPQYAPLVDALIGFAVESSKNGMEGAPERPGAEIMVSEKAGLEAKSLLENALPQSGSLSSITITEQQVTSWLAMGMQNNPDLPLDDVQVYLRNGKIQVWGVVTGNDTSTSALIIGTVSIDGNKHPHFKIESIQIGQQTIPSLLTAQVESWLNQSLTDKINGHLPGLELMNVNVTNGLITISGMR